MTRAIYDSEKKDRAPLLDENLSCRQNLDKAAGRIPGKYDIVRRHPANPLITINDVPEGSPCVFNSGFIEYDGKVHGILHAPYRNFKKRFLHCVSDDGVNFQIDEKNIVPEVKDEWFDQGIYDVRITKLEGRYYYTCNVGHDSYGTRILLNVTDDFEKFETLGFVTAPSQRNCVLFPEKINGMYARLERPHGGGTEGDIYISQSPDLEFWGRTKMLYASGHNYWESLKVGPGAPPLKTEEGWLVIYHGVSGTFNGMCYYAGCMLLDLENPEVVRCVMDEFLIAPDFPYELNGHTPNVVFPTAAFTFGDPDNLHIYYGAADSAVCLAHISQKELVAECLKHPYKRHWNF